MQSTLEFIANPANKSPKRGALRLLRSVETPDAATVVIRRREPYASFSVNLIATAIGIVPANGGADFSRHPIGSGPFRFVPQSQDEEAIVERNPEYFGGAPSLTRVRFRVVPDAVVRALELRNGSADLEISSLSPDIIPVLARQPDLKVTDRNGTNSQLFRIQPRRSTSVSSRNSTGACFRNGPRSAYAKGNFQLTYQRWVGANTDPDFFEYAFSSKRFPPDGANRGHYRNARIDALTDRIRVEMNQGNRKALCGEVQKILAEDLPYLPLWFNDVVSVHRRSLGELALPSTGNYNFLATLKQAGN